ncbi:MAG: tetratricopeptide repeat protein [Rhodospirillaceae bacterium]|nr:tetratricopeptide repeat protein [Rhodospirillaceae bacterium]
MSIQEKLSTALAFHQQGQLLEAGELYREILAEDPDQVDALNLMGVVMQAAGDLEVALDLLGRATELAPDYFAPFANLGNVLQASGRLLDAVEAFETALKLNGDSPETANNLSSVQNELGNPIAGLEASERALSLIPQFPEAIINKGNALLALARPVEAVNAYREALTLAPDNARAHFNLGNAYLDLEAYAEAVEPYLKSVTLDDRNAKAWFNYANCLVELDRIDDAVGCFQRALSIEPDYVDALCNLASALQSLGRTGDAIDLLRKALISQPDSPDLHWNLSLTLLQHGDYSQGWREYDWRWKMPTFEDYRRDFDRPKWDGGPLDGRRILIQAEQGFGDCIEFCRYIPMVAAMGGEVVLECRPELNRLLGTLDGVAKRIDLGAPLPEYDVHTPLMSLPRIFNTDLQTVPSDIPYLDVPKDAILDHAVLSATGLKVGLVWAGSPTRRDNHKRSCGLQALTDLMSIERVDYFSFQVGPEASELQNDPLFAGVADIAAGFSDFADTAAAVADMDLIISVDTSVLHLAGALGKPVWGMLSTPTGFLWMNDRLDSPWYPTLRLFRQPQPGDWDSVVAEVCSALEERLAKSPQG